MFKAITFGTRSFRDLETSQNNLHFQVTNAMVFKMPLGPSGSQSVAKVKLLIQFIIKKKKFDSGTIGATKGKKKI